MRVNSLLPLGALVVGATAQTSTESFEPQDFNVRSALEKLGVDASKLPETDTSLTPRSPVGQCSHAASQVYTQRNCFGH